MVRSNEPLSVVEHFGKLQDARMERAGRHELKDITVIALCAVICGADNWVESEEFSKAKEAGWDFLYLLKVLSQ